MSDYKIEVDQAKNTKTMLSKDGVKIFSFKMPITNKRMFEILSLVKFNYSSGFLAGQSHDRLLRSKRKVKKERNHARI